MGTTGEDATLGDEGVRALQRGLAVLDCILGGPRTGVRVVELMRSCELGRATVYRVLATLIACGYVARNGRFHYVRGARLEASAAAPVDNLASRLGPVLQRISEITEDAAFAVVREGTQSHCIARHIGTFPVQVLTVQVGRRQPLGVGAAGLALLASIAPEEAGVIIDANAAALAAYGGMTSKRLHLLLKATRERGWSVVGNHVVDDTLGVGIPVPGSGGQSVAAISVAAPLQRMSQARQHFIVNTMRSTLKALVPKGL
ncbi:IclR family transcriptional regulator [Variovorax rhizosphaerae]|uniref:IclR family transcriptional regulator C-terminal domain-containing protein n=1 Tax=Variovorax rhizosphaerae TaxID=1836200 RepID=A0ABU8WF70_9BURK